MPFLLMKNNQHEVQDSQLEAEIPSSTVVLLPEERLLSLARLVVACSGVGLRSTVTATTEDCTSLGSSCLLLVQQKTRCTPFSKLALTSRSQPMTLLCSTLPTSRF